MKPMHSALALSAAIAVAGFALSANPAAAANSAMATCNKQWNDETAANSTNGVAYQDFLKTCLKGAAAAPAAPAAGGATVAQATTTATTPAATTAVDPATTAAKKDCASQFKTAKAADPTLTTTKKDFVNACLAKAGIAVPASTTTATPATTPASTTADPTTAKAKRDCAAQFKTAKAADPTLTQTKADFVNACLAKAGITVPAKKGTTTATAPATMTPAATTPAAATTTTTAVAPVKPAATTPAASTPAATTTTAATTATTTTATTPAKPKSPAQLAEQARIKECGDQWKTLKANNQTNGQTWPQFWHTCDTQLKASAAGGAAPAAATTTTQ